MSDTPQGPGWWLASDGKYYAPEQASPPPPATPPPVPPPIPPPSAQPLTPPPLEPAKKGGNGCIYALIAVAAVIVLGVIGSILAIVFLGGKAADKIQDAAEQKPCPFLTDSQASNAIGQDVQAVKMSGFYEFLRITVDTRVLADATDCVMITSSDAAVGRAAKYEGSDAGSKFAQEKDVADGTSQDQGGGLSLETESYMSDQAVTVGDEGFCTTSSFLAGAGALVRKGDTLVYVSIQPDFSSSDTTPQVDVENGGFATDAGACTQAQELASKILG